MNKLSVKQVDVKGKRVLIRVDFNVPLNKSTGEITSTQRIDAALPTLHHVRANGASRIILVSHLGRPDGHVVPGLSLGVVAKQLETCLNLPVLLVSARPGTPECANECAKAPAGGIVLLENIRFYPEEEGKGASADAISALSKGLTELADVFVNDAFGTAHRAHASMVGVTLPVRCAGLLLARELDYFSKALESPVKPYCAVLGGAKVGDKIQLIRNLLPLVDEMIIGGGMAFTFAKVIDGHAIGASLFDEEGAKIVAQLVADAAAADVQLHRPIDYVIANKFAADAETKVVDAAEGVPEGWMGLDIGPKTTAAFAEVAKRAKTLVWNGPMGVFEFKAFEAGTRGLMDAVVAATASGSTTIIGGGDTATACANFGAEDKVSHVSTGGGASLELLEGKVLPGVAALCDNAKL